MFALRHNLWVRQASGATRAKMHAHINGEKVV